MEVAGGNWGIISTGPDATNVQTVLPSEATRPVSEVAAPPGLVNLPVRTAVFVGRDGDLADLDTALASQGPVLAVVHGLGGVGKSTLAARYAAAYASESGPVWWIAADGAAGIQAGLAALAVALQPELAAVLPLEALAERATAWLACHEDWLLVLDDVTDPAEAVPLLGRGLSGRVLVTSRLSEGWHRLGAHVLRLDVLAEQEAIELLARISSSPGTHREAGPDRDDVALVRELGCLPLAVEQAAAYLRQTRLAPRAYLDLLAGQPTVMYDRATRGSDAERTMARIWRITLDQLADTPMAGLLLRVLAWWAPEAIDRTLLDGFTDPSAAPEALGALAAYNMITLTPESVTVHRLVQAVARTPDPADPHRQPVDIDAARDLAALLLSAGVPDGYKDPAGWPALRALLPHIDALTSHASPATDTPATRFLLLAAGLFLHDQGAARRATALLDRCLTTSQRLFGDHHPETLAARSHLAYAYQTAGDLDQAIPLFEQTRSDVASVLGDDHPATLSSGNNLAFAYKAAGDLGRAIPLYEQTVIDSVRAWGEDDPFTLAARHNLAGAYEAAGNLERAIPLFEQTLADRQRVLDDDDPDTLASHHVLAHAYAVAGELGRAIPMFEQTLADRQRVLGAEHPDTLDSRYNLACAYEAAGNLAHAIPLFEQTATDAVRVLDEDNPFTLLSRRHLARAHEAAGDLERAIEVYEWIFNDSARVLGDDSPGTLNALLDLAGVYEAAGDLEQAVHLFEQAVTDAARVLGEDDLGTLNARHNLAGLYERAGDLERAIDLYDRTLTDSVRVLGEDDPDTLVSRNNLAAAHQAAGHLDLAITLFEQAVIDAARTLGDDDSFTLSLSHNLAAAYQAAGNPRKAVTLFEHLLIRATQSLGEDHPSTLNTRNSLAGAYEAVGDLGRAIPLFEQTLAGAIRVLGPQHPFTLMVRGNLEAPRPRQ